MSFMFAVFADIVVVKIGTAEVSTKANFAQTETIKETVYIVNIP